MGRSSFFATLARVMTSAAAPSDMDDALAAVIVPASAKAGFNKAIFSGLAFPGCSSVSTSISPPRPGTRSEEHTSELQSLMRTSYAVFCLKKKTTHNTQKKPHTMTHINTHTTYIHPN